MVADLPADPVMLDVREDYEWDAGHAPGAVHVRMSELAERLDEIPDESPLYVICRVGGRSARVTQYLNATGWDAVNVVDGMSGWVRAGRPMESETGKPPTVL
jgi:rhodanese-related sulfurtransferase